MKRVITKKQKELFKPRSIIETSWGVLKERFKLVFNLARSINGLFCHYFYSFSSYILKSIIKSGQLLPIL